MAPQTNDERLARLEKLLTTAVEAMCDLCATLTDNMPDQTAGDLMSIRLQLLDALVDFTSE